MCEVLTYNITQVNNYDPTRTTTLRNAFANNMNRRFRELKKVIVRSIIMEDCFGLKSGITAQQMSSPGYRAFAFQRSDLKLDAFMRWLQEQVDAGMLTLGQYNQIGQAIESAWTNQYIFDSYKRGVIRARYEMKKAGYNVPSIDDTGGIFFSMNTPFHLDRLGLLYTRVFTELKGITADMDMKISRILAQGIADGDGPRLLARKLLSVIDGSDAGTLGITDSLGRFIPPQRRAELLARTEIIRAHHVATIQEYRNWAVEGVIVKGEWKTAGDDRVCPKCESMDGKEFTLDEIEPLIPLHPLCRCIALPKIVEIIKPK